MLDGRVAEDLVGAVLERSGEAALVDDRRTKLRHEPSQRLHLRPEPFADLSGEILGARLVPRDAQRETVEGERDDGEFLDRPVVQLRGNAHSLFLGNFDRPRQQTCALLLRLLQLRVLHLRAGEQGFAVLLGLLAAVTSSAKPWLYQGAPLSSSTVVALSESQTYVPSCARNRYSIWSGSPLSRAVRCRSRTRLRSSGWMRSS